MKNFVLFLSLFTFLGMTTSCGIKGKPLPPLNENEVKDQKSESEKKKNQ